jgi:hypothetical protein
MQLLMLASGWDQHVLDDGGDEWPLEGFMEPAGTASVVLAA